MYPFMLFLHVLGVLFMFAAVGLTLSGMIGMISSKDNKSLAIWSKLTAKADGFLPFSVILILLPALYMVIKSWGWQIAWLNVSLVALILMTLAGPLINLKRIKAIEKAVEQEISESPSPDLREKICDIVLWRSVTIMTLEVLAIVYLMCVKPGFIESLFAILIAIVVGIISIQIFFKNIVTTKAQVI